MVICDDRWWRWAGGGKGEDLGDGDVGNCDDGFWSLLARIEATEKLLDLRILVSPLFNDIANNLNAKTNEQHLYNITHTENIVYSFFFLDLNSLRYVLKKSFSSVKQFF